MIEDAFTYIYLAAFFFFFFFFLASPSSSAVSSQYSEEVLLLAAVIAASLSSWSLTWCLTWPPPISCLLLSTEVTSSLLSFFISRCLLARTARISLWKLTTDCRKVSRPEQTLRWCSCADWFRPLLCKSSLYLAIRFLHCFAT